MERPSPAAGTATTTAARWLRARATSALANAGAAARTASAAAAAATTAATTAARTASAAAATATTAATTAARAALPTVGPSSPVLVPVATAAATDGDEDDWHMVTAEDHAHPSSPSGPAETEEELSRRWHRMKPHLDAAIRAGDMEAARTWRAAMSKVNREVAALQRAKVERERREAERAAEAERERRDAANRGWTRELLVRGMGAVAFRKPSERKEEEGKPPENSFNREDEDEEDKVEESAEACVSKDEGEDDEEDDPEVFEDALDEQ